MKFLILSGLCMAVKYMYIVLYLSYVHVYICMYTCVHVTSFENCYHDDRSRFLKC